MELLSSFSIILFIIIYLLSSWVSAGRQTDRPPFWKHHPSSIINHINIQISIQRFSFLSSNVPIFHHQSSSAEWWKSSGRMDRKRARSLFCLLVCYYEVSGYQRYNNHRRETFSPSSSLATTSPLVGWIPSHNRRCHRQQQRRRRQNYRQGYYDCLRSFSSLQLSRADDTIASDNDEERDQRLLRFGGVGRLYAASVDKDDHTSDENPQKLLPEELVLARLGAATVVVIGLGGVGSWAAEAIVRSGVGRAVLIDLDDICISNTNRQLHASTSTIGEMKVDAMQRRLRDINPACNISVVHDFVTPDNVHDILSQCVSISKRETPAAPASFAAKATKSDPTLMVLDAIDGGKEKSALLAACTDLRIPVVTSGAAAGLQDPSRIKVADLTLVEEDKLLATVRKNLRKLYGFPAGLAFHEKAKKKTKQKWRIEAVYSDEPQKERPRPASADKNTDNTSSFRLCDGALGTACFVTGTIGFVAAGLVVDHIAKDSASPPRNSRYMAKRA